MSMAYLGTRFEIHGGGADLIFPHHESELAQSEGATGDRPFVEWWTHAGMLHFDDEKMSKSLGNLVLVRDLLRSYSGDAIRHYLVSRHYRSEVHFTDGRSRRLGRCRRPPARGLPARRGALARRSGAGRRRRPRAGRGRPPREIPGRHGRRPRHAGRPPRARGTRQARAQRGTTATSPHRRAGWSASSEPAFSGCAWRRRPCRRAARRRHDRGPGRRPGPDQRPPRRGRSAGGPGGLDASTDLGCGRSACLRGRSSRWPGSSSRHRARRTLPCRPPISSPSRSRLEQRPPALRRWVRPGQRPQHLVPACSPRWWSSSSAW